MSEMLRVVMVEPQKVPEVKEIPAKLHEYQKAVGGLIELVYNGDGTIIVCNDEGKLRGMEGNRRLDNGAIIAGPFFVVGDMGEDFRSLTDREVQRYLDRFQEIENISQKEVRSDMGFRFISF